MKTIFRKTRGVLLSLTSLALYFILSIGLFNR
jgi:hypothetical protein